MKTYIMKMECYDEISEGVFILTAIDDALAEITISTPICRAA
jgi:hypothetical protein